MGAVLFLLFNRVFSPQYLGYAVWAVAGSLFARTAREQLLFGLLMLSATLVLCLFATSPTLLFLCAVSVTLLARRAGVHARNDQWAGVGIAAMVPMLQRHESCGLAGPRIRGVTERTVFPSGSSPSVTVVAGTGRR